MNSGRTFLWNAVIGLLVMGLGGCGAIYCAKAYGLEPWYFAGRQMLWLGVGVILFLITAQIPFSVLKKAAFPTAAVCWGLLMTL